MSPAKGSRLARAVYVFDNTFVGLERRARVLDRLSLWVGIALAVFGTALVRLDASHPDRPFVDHPWLERINRLSVAYVRVPLADVLTVLGLVLALAGVVSMGLRWFNRIGSTKS